MKTVLLVSYHFPPCGGKAVQRASKLARHLPAFGWRPVIFSMPLGEPGVPLDASLAAELPSGIEVHRPPFRDWRWMIPHDIRKLFPRPLPDKYRPWADASVPRLVQLIKDSGARAMITTSPSHSVQLLGLAARRGTGIPWVADFRDPWSGHPDFPAKSHADRMFSLETRVLESADAVVGVYPKILRDFEARIPRDRLHLIENGYDEDDFMLADTATRNAALPVVMGHNGTVSDFHDPAPLLDVLDAMLAGGRLDPAALKVVFTTGESGMKRFARYTELTRAGVLVVEGYRPHAESLARLAEMDVSLLLLTRGRDIFPGKLFEYFRIRNHVLSLSEPGDDLDLLIRETGTGEVVDHRDPAAIERAVSALIERKRSGGDGPVEPLTPIERFSRRGVAERYGALLDAVTGT